MALHDLGHQLASLSFFVAALGLVQLGRPQSATPMTCYLTYDTICGEPRLLAAARRVYIGRSLRQHGDSCRRTEGPTPVSPVIWDNDTLH